MGAVDIAYFLEARRQVVPGPYDIGLVEGSISTPEEEERIRRARTRPGLMALLRHGKRDYRFVNAADLGFAVGPRLNAAGRLEDMGAGIRCLLSEDPQEAGRLAAQLDELNRQRRDMQEQMQASAMEQVTALLETLDRQTLPHALCLFEEGWHQGVVGLVASRVKDRVHRPVVAFAPEQPGSSLLKGSARSIGGLHIRDALARVDSLQPGLMQAFGGHAMAAGLSPSSEPKLPWPSTSSWRIEKSCAMRTMVS